MTRNEARLDRRAFGRLAGAGVLGAWAAPAPALPETPPASPASPRARMKVGTQHGSSDEILTVLAALGVNHICSALPSAPARRGLVGGRTHAAPRARRVVRHQTRHGAAAAEFRLHHALGEPQHHAGQESGARPRDRRHLPDDPQRRAGRHSGAEVQHERSSAWCEPSRRRAAAASRYSTFDYARRKQEPPLTEAGPVSADAAWERITYFLKRVMPVAEEYKVRIACHPHDPGMPRGQGVPRRAPRARAAWTD